MLIISNCNSFLFSFCILIFIKQNICSILTPLVPSEIYTHHESVIDDDKNRFHIFWKVLSSDEIQFEVHCRTTGWVGLGISSNGGMKGADIAIGWYDSSGPHLKV